MIITGKNKKIKICDMSNFRMDFEFINFYEKPNDNSLYVRSIPNRERYELTEIDGVAGYWDKFDNCFFPLSLCQKIGNGIVFILFAKVIQSGCVSGSDNYCLDRRLKNRPEQTITVVGDEGLICIYDVKVD